MTSIMDAPEQNLSALRIRPINVSLLIAAQAARAYPKREREAVLWLTNLAANSQRIQLCWQRRRMPDPLGTVGRITEVALSAKLGLEPIEIYKALTGADDAELPRFTEAVEAFRREFEKSLPPLVGTEDIKTMERAFKVAGLDHSIVEARGKWRAGKTELAERQWLLNLHDTVWVDCPSSSDRRSFVFAIACTLGLRTSSNTKMNQVEPRIKSSLGIGLISRLVIDEAHNLWPQNLRDAKPERIEFLRELRDQLGIGSLLNTTEQFALSMELAAQHNTRWAPGQFIGRRSQYILRDTHTDAEIREIARLHAGSIDADAVAGLVAFAKADEGYLGTMVEAIKLARAEHGDVRLTAPMIAAATKQQMKQERITELAKGAQRLPKGRFKLLPGGKAA